MLYKIAVHLLKTESGPGAGQGLCMHLDIVSSQFLDDCLDSMSSYFNATLAEGSEVQLNQKH